MVSSHQLLHGLSRDPAVHELDRRLVAERGVMTTPVVMGLDVIEQIGVRRDVRLLVSTVHPFDCVEVSYNRRRRHSSLGYASPARGPRRLGQSSA